ncbi:hypothetical protein [Hyphomicrobium sp.]|uniref:hypothetical protein n=1 Tax=Hyphomicrobium sp. TaxID=82 RepID=UPI002FDE6DE8
MADVPAAAVSLVSLTLLMARVLGLLLPAAAAAFGAGLTAARAGFFGVTAFDLTAFALAGTDFAADFGAAFLTAVLGFAAFDVDVARLLIGASIIGLPKLTYVPLAPTQIQGASGPKRPATLY